MASNGTALGMVRPGPSVMATSSSLTLSHFFLSYPLSPRSQAQYTLTSLLPSPNGISLVLLTPPNLSSQVLSNLSGLKLSASSQDLGSLCMAQALTNNIVPRGTSYPPMVQLLDKNGAAGYSRKVPEIPSRKVPEIIFRRYGSLERSALSIKC
ncbi:hypothetical protein TorRG33x02_214390 [Trema orientale]|uniref:Uncharacterized protein n=1 Tax=Trema orientale TaxID=63057 RepID=A0A2P5EAU0_TREOI|nr:hypothetical protein TorRG33x02_214390 [Trema orientale]